MIRLLIPILTLATASAAFAQWTPFPRADLVLGNRETLENALDKPGGIAIDEVRHKIYVSCSDSNRVLRYDIASVLSGAALLTAEAVLGQPDYYSDGESMTASTMNNPGGLAVDSNGVLWVADQGNRRVLRFNNAHAKLTGANADGVLGPANFTTFSYFFGGTISVTVDSLGNLYVSDSGNNRVCRYNAAATKANGAMPDAVFGQPDMASNSSGLTASKLLHPAGIFATSGASPMLWVVDKGNNRVLRFDNAHTAPSGPIAASVLGQPDMVTNAAGNAMSRFDQPVDVAVLGSCLYVSDPGNYRTLRFSSATPPLNASATANLRSDPTVAGGPVMLAVQPVAGRLWGTRNKAIVRFDTPASGSGSILRNAAFGSESLFMLSVRDVAIDPVSGKVFVAECGSNPKGVGRFANYAALLGGAQPEAWICQLQSSASVDYGGGLYCAQGLSIDNQGRLWVADPISRAVYRYDNAATIGAYTPATAYLGGAPGTAANQMTGPFDVYADPQGRVWVADRDNHRVLRFDNAASKPNGGPANAVLGQTGFGVAVAGVNPTIFNLNLPTGVVGDGIGNIWVADRGNHRVLRYNNAAAKANGAAANAVLGQPNDTTAIGALGATGLDQPFQLAWESGGHLWVSEEGNKRVMRFKNALTLGNGAAADFVVGQPDFGRNDTRQDFQHIVTPAGITVDPLGRLYVADKNGNRVMRFSPVEVKIIQCGLNNQKRFTLTYTSTPGAQYDIESSPDLVFWSFEGTQVAAGSTTNWISPLPVSGPLRHYRVKGR